MTVNKADRTVSALVEMIARGELRLPEMQRRYVWKATRVRDLLDSLYRGYPSGAILVWETEGDVPMRDLSVDQAATPYSTHKLLLDGQQRLTSLSAVLRGKPVQVRDRKRPIEILFNLDHPEDVEEVVEVEDDEPGDEEDERDTEESEDESEESDVDDGEAGLQARLRTLTFVVSSKQLAALPNWVSVSDVMTRTELEILKEAGIEDLFRDPRATRYMERLKRLRAIRDYPYVMHLLDRKLSYAEVAEIFVRVNSLGVKLKSSDLALAQITARWRNLLPLLEKFEAECAAVGFPLDQGWLVRAMVVFASGQSRFKTLSGISTERLQQGWEAAKKSIRFATNFLSSNGGVPSVRLLSSPAFLLTIGYHHWKNPEPDAAERATLLEWALVGSARGHYAGSMETTLDADLARLRDGRGASGLRDGLLQTYGRLRFNAQDFAGRSTAGGLFSLMYVVLKARGATDWRSGLVISLSQRANKHDIQRHHIFPRGQISDLYHRRQVNEIANLAFCGGDTNRQINKRPPVKYLADVIEREGRRVLETQCVPVDRALWTIEAYPEFLAERRRLLAEAINQHLDGLHVQPAVDLLEARWPALCEALLERGYTHGRLRGRKDPRPFLPAAADPDALGSELLLALEAARAPAAAGFDESKYSPTDLLGLHRQLLLLLDGLERSEDETGEEAGLAKRARIILARTAALLVEPLLAMLLILLEPQAFQQRLARYAEKKSPVGISLLFQLLRETSRSPLPEEFVRLDPKSTDGWEELDTVSNAMRDLLALRLTEAHGAPDLTSEEADQAAWSAVVVLIAFVEHNATDLRGALSKRDPGAERPTTP